MLVKAMLQSTVSNRKARILLRQIVSKTSLNYHDVIADLQKLPKCKKVLGLQIAAIDKTQNSQSSCLRNE